jgi:hypothetical protein
MRRRFLTGVIQDLTLNRHSFSPEKTGKSGNRLRKCIMGRTMTPTARDRAVQRISTQLIEEVGADAVIIVFSRTKRNTTTTHLHTWGNMLACRGLAEEAYGHLCEGLEPDTEEGDADA